MLNHPTLEKLNSLRLSGMASALQEQWEIDGIDEMSFEERLGLLVDREAVVRETRRLQTRLRKANSDSMPVSRISISGTEYVNENETPCAIN